tara:strand:- start:1172 stop:1402 length:231 start_codon:yes stop_codon:yes gene_type:complete
MVVQPQAPIVVDTVNQPLITPEIGMAEVVLSAAGMAGIIMALALLGGILIGACIIFLRKSRSASEGTTSEGWRLRG